jgi:hypothetical protein
MKFCSITLALSLLALACDTDRSVRTFDELNFAMSASGIDYDEGGGNITITTCDVAGPMETTAIFEVKTAPEVHPESPDCRVVDEFARPVHSVVVTPIAHIAGEQLPSSMPLFSFSHIPVYDFRPGDLVLGTVRRTGDSWFLNSSHWVYDDETPLRPGFNEAGHTFTYNLPTTFNELVADSNAVRSDFLNRCEGKANFEFRMQTDEEFYAYTRERSRPKICPEDEPQPDEGPTNNNTQD